MRGRGFEHGPRPNPDHNSVKVGLRMSPVWSWVTDSTFVWKMMKGACFVASVEPELVAQFTAGHDAGL